MTALLNRLEGVRETGSRRWIARCPSHDDRSPSLSIRLADGDTWLLHCFAGFASTDVVAALGLEFSDLYPDRPEHYRAPKRTRIPASDLIKIMADEAVTVGLIAGWFLDGREIVEDDWDRLSLAVRRIGEAQSHAT